MKKIESKCISQLVAKNILGLLLCTSFSIASEQQLEDPSTAHSQQALRHAPKIRIVFDRSSTNPMQQAPIQQALAQQVLLTKEDALPLLTIHMDHEEAAVINAALNAIDASKLTADFISRVNKLSAGMNENDKAKVMNILSTVDSLHLEKLTLLAPRIFSGCDTEEKLLVLEILSKTNPDQVDDMTSYLHKALFRGGTKQGIDKKTLLTGKLKDVNDLLQPVVPVIHAIPQTFTVDEVLNALECSAYKAGWIRKILAKVPTAHMTPSFVDLLKSMQSAKQPAFQSTIDILTNPKKNPVTPGFLDYINRLTVGMDGDNKSSVIVALAKLPPERLTREFVDYINRGSY